MHNVLPSDPMRDVRNLEGALRRTTDTCVFFPFLFEAYVTHILPRE